MTETIQQLKEEIALLQQKLQELQEPDMTLKKSGDCDMVSYDHKYYYRLSFGVDYYWYKRYIGSSNLMRVEDPEEHRLVEELYEGVILDTGVVEEQGTWNYDPDAKFRKQAQERGERVHNEMEKIFDGYEVVEYQPTPQNPEQVADGLKEAFREAVKQGVVSSVDNPKDDFDDPIEGLMKDPPECLKFSLGKTLEQVITRWWEDTFTLHENWNIEECIDDLIDQVELWLVKPQSAEGTQRIETEIAVEAHNDLLRKIKSKLRNKKDT